MKQNPHFFPKVPFLTNKLITWLGRVLSKRIVTHCCRTQGRRQQDDFFPLCLYSLLKRCYYNFSSPQFLFTLKLLKSGRIPYVSLYFKCSFPENEVKWLINTFTLYSHHTNHTLVFWTKKAIGWTFQNSLSLKFMLRYGLHITRKIFKNLDTLRNGSKFSTYCGSLPILDLTIEVIHFLTTRRQFVHRII